VVGDDAGAELEVEALVAGAAEVVGAAVLVELLQAAASTVRTAPTSSQGLRVIMAGEPSLLVTS
jgi:hypothetical protein